MDTKMRLQVAAGSALIGAGVASHDYIKSPFGRALSYGSLVLSGAGVIATSQDVSGKGSIFGEDSAVMVDQLRQEIGDLGVVPGPESDVDAMNERGPLLTWLLLGVFALVFVAFIYASIRMDMAIMKKVAGFFHKRGARRPFSCTGMVYAAAIYALYEIEAGIK